MAWLNPTKEQVLRAIELTGANNYDMVVEAGDVGTDIEMPHGTVSFAIKSKTLRPSRSAELQYLNRINVPGQFFSRCSNQLKLQILREFHKNRSFLFRCRKHQDLGGSWGPDRLRAVLGPRFPVERDDHILFPVVLEALGDENIQIASFEISDHVTELVVNFEDTNVLMDGHTVKGSISITNSETGHSSLWIEPHIQIFNGMWIGNRFGDGQYGSRYVHRGTLPSVEELREDIQNAKKIAQIGIIQFLENQGTRVPMSSAVKYMEDLEALPARFSTLLSNELKDQEFILKGELVRRILLAANDLPLLQSLQLRRHLGGYLGIFNDTASRLANLANEINQ